MTKLKPTPADKWYAGALERYYFATECISALPPDMTMDEVEEAVEAVRVATWRWSFAQAGVPVPFDEFVELDLDEEEREILNTTVLNATKISLLSKWSACRHVYEIDRELFPYVRLQENDDLPLWVLDKMPYDVIFVRFPQAIPCKSFEERSHDDAQGCELCSGFFAVKYNGILGIIALSASDPTVDTEIVTLDIKRAEGLDLQYPLMKLVEILVERSAESAEHMPPLLKKYKGGSGETADSSDNLKTFLEYAFGALAYICTEEAEADSVVVYSPSGKRRRPSARLSESTVHEVGVVAGRTIGQARKHYLSEEADGHSGRKVAPHVRRAHYHCYYLGPKDNPTGIAVHWLPPIFVNADQEGNPPNTTVHAS